VLDGHDISGLKDDVRNLAMLARQRRRRRFSSGSLKLDTVKLCFKCDEQGLPTETWTYDIKESNSLVRTMRP
jgi:exoribonuclease R